MRTESPDIPQDMLRLLMHFGRWRSAHKPISTASLPGWTKWSQNNGRWKLPTGFHDAVALAPAGAPARAYEESSDMPVPGARSPVRTVYHAAQALRWVASRRA